MESQDDAKWTLIYIEYDEESIPGACHYDSLEELMDDCESDLDED